MWNSRITAPLPQGSGEPKIYAVNWLGKRIFEVKPEKATDENVTFQSARHDDIFCYEIAR